MIKKINRDKILSKEQEQMLRKGAMYTSMSYMLMECSDQNKSLDKFMRKSKVEIYWDTPEEYFEWWKSKKNVKEYMEAKKQYKLF